MSVGAHSQPHDKINIVVDRRLLISEKGPQLYASGMSLESIARELGVAKSTVLRNFEEGDIPRRPATQSLEGKLIGNRKYISGHAPYGYVVIRGQLVSDPKEMETVREILNLWNSGTSFSAIARALNACGRKTRTGCKWRHPIVAAIIRRQTV